MSITGIRENAAGWVSIVRVTPPVPAAHKKAWFLAQLFDVGVLRKSTSGQADPVIARAAFRDAEVVGFADRAVDAIKTIAESESCRHGRLGSPEIVDMMLCHRLFDTLENMLHIDKIATKTALIQANSDNADITASSADALAESIRIKVSEPVEKLENLAASTIMLDLQATLDNDFYLPDSSSFDDLEGRVLAAVEVRGL